VDGFPTGVVGFPTGVDGLQPGWMDFQPGWMDFQPGWKDFQPVALTTENCQKYFVLLPEVWDSKVTRDSEQCYKSMPVRLK